MRYNLLDICDYAKDRVDTVALNEDTYISTENMLSNKGGVCKASSLPSVQQVQSFHKGDVLVSNIRPYFKKIWFAEFDGGCSNDVLVFRVKKGVNSRFLYYLLAADAFFEYSMATSKGTKMPRGDKVAIMKYGIPHFKYEEQEKIAAVLDIFDRKIRLNIKINDNLQQQAFALFDQLMLESGDSKCLVSEVAYLNPKRQLSKNQVARCIDMSQLSTSGAFPSGWDMKPFNGGMRFINGDTLLARITPCLENGKTAYIDFLDEKEVAFGSTEYIVLAPREGVPPEYLYCLARYPAFVDYAVKNMNGSSGRQRVSADTIGKFVMNHPSKDALRNFGDIAAALFMKMRYNSFENLRLASFRDAILPRLMSGELDVSALDL